jgi:hypothetical protein
MVVTIGTAFFVATTAAAKPTVMLTGPSVLAPGRMATYTLTITGGAAVAGGRCSRDHAVRRRQLDQQGRHEFGRSRRGDDDDD